MLRVRQAIIVEGRYDKAKLHSLVDATIVTTDGFGVFRNREKLAYIRRLAAQTGIIILTDSAFLNCNYIVLHQVFLEKHS